MSKRAIMTCSPSSGNNFTVILIYGYLCPKICFWTHGDSTWTGIEGEDYYDIAFSKNTLFALKRHQGGKSAIETWDFSFVSETSKKLCIELPFLNDHLHTSRLATLSMSGEVLIVNNRLIWKVDSRQRCVQMTSLNGEALLMGSVNTMCISHADVEYHGFKSNSIYYVEDGRPLLPGTSEIRLRVYSMEDKTTEELWRSHVCCGKVSPEAIWIISPHL